MGSRFFSPRRAVAVLAVAGTLFGGGAVAAMQANAAGPPDVKGFLGFITVKADAPWQAAWDACERESYGSQVRSVKITGRVTRSDGVRSSDEYACSSSPTP